MLPAHLRPPLWARWVLSIGIGLILLLALILFVEHNNTDSEATQNPAAVERANREAAAVVAEDQAPHVAAVAAAEGAGHALAKAVHADMTSLINRGVLEGPLGRTWCARSGAAGGRQAFRCTAVAGGLNYAFVGVVDARARRLTYCKRDAPPAPSVNVPVSPRCRLTSS